MFWGRLSILFFIYLSSVLECISQPVAGFTFSPTACRNETIQLTNTSTKATRYTWDFCHHDLVSSPTIAQDFILPVTGSNFYNSIKLVYDNGVWTGFVTDAAERKLLRLDYGDNINTTPIVNDLGNLGVLTSPGPVDLVKEGGIWYVFIANIFQNKILRMTLGNGIRSAPTLIEDNVINGSTPIGIRLVHSGALKYLVVSYLSSNSVAVYDFGGSFTGAPVSSTTTTNSLFVEVWGVDVISDGTNWYGMVVSAGNTKVLRLNFGSSLLNIPTVDDIGSIPTPSQVKLVKEGLDFVGFVRSRDNGVYRVIFGNTLLQTPIVERLATSLLQGESRSLEIVKQSPGWNALTMEARTGNLYKLDFEANCKSEISINNSIVTTPLNLNYSVASDYYVELSAFDGNNHIDISSQILKISSNVAPIIDIVIDANKCLNATNTIQVNSSKTLVSQTWNFNDSFSSTINPTFHSFSASGNNNINVQVMDIDGCHNFTQKNIKIYDPPTSSFTLPPGLICTNNEFTFTNNTVDNFDGNLNYEWSVNNVPVSNTRDFKYAFGAVGDQQITLKTAIPGCFNELTQTLLNVQAGPTVGFNFTGKCEDEAIVFSNQSSGDISGYQWDFGNGNTSTQVNPTEIYPAYGTYNVSLVTTGINGCASTLIKPVSIYSVPQTNFSLDLPPFSCSASLSQFNDLTPPMPDSNITSWAWSFGDQSGGISSQKNPLYTYSLAGDYPVSLTTTTNFGCSNTSQKTVTIHPSPKADFSFGPACVNQGTQFTDLSTGDIKSRLWSIQSNTYAVKNPVHTFKSAAAYEAMLTVTGNNNCKNQLTKSVLVPVPVVAAFTSQSTCATKPAVFDEVNKGGTDPAATWEWYFDNDGPVSGSPATNVFASTGNHSVTMKTIRQSGCVYSVTETIPIAESPRAQFSVFLDAGAAPFPVDFVNTSTRASSYSWTFGDAAHTTSSLFSPSFTYSQLGDYTAELTVENDLKCKDSFSRLIHVVVPRINAAISDFKMTNVPGGDRWSSIVTIENKSNVALINPDVYLDISGNAVIIEKVMGVIQPNALLTHTFATTMMPRGVVFACAEISVSADDYLFDNRQCVNLLDQPIARDPYPNPASNELMLEWINISSEPMEVIIYNSAGQVIINRQYDPSLKGLNQVRVDVSALAVGIYYVSYRIESQTQHFRFSVVR